MNIDSIAVDTAKMYLDYVQRLPWRSNYAVNIGASDGTTEDIIVDLFRAGSAGLAVEMDPDKYNLLCRNLPPAVSKHHGPATPDNIVRILATYGAPLQPDAVDIDIDGYDLEVAKALVADYKPAIVSVEINEDVPPGITYTTLYRAGFRWAGEATMGSSIDAIDTAMSARGYTLLRVEWHNSFFVRNDLAYVFKSELPKDTRTAWLDGYWNRPHKYEVYDWKNWPVCQAIGDGSTHQAFCLLRERFANHDPSHYVLKLTG